MAQPQAQAHAPQAPHLHPHDYLHPNPHPHPRQPAPEEGDGTDRPHVYNIPPPPPNNPFLNGLLLRTLRVTTTDGRWFVGEFKCTDRDRNLILERTHEYRGSDPTTMGGVATKVTTTTTTITAITDTDTEEVGEEGQGGSDRAGESTTRLVDGAEGTVEIPVGGGAGAGAGVAAEGGTDEQQKQQPQCTRRFIGLVVIPGEVIVKIELEESRVGMEQSRFMRRMV